MPGVGSWSSLKVQRCVLTGSASGLDEGFLDATTLMEFLIQRNVPQRTAHEVIGRMVNLCERRGVRQLVDLSDAELADAHPQLGPEVRSLLGVQNAIKAFRSYGSTAPAEVERQLGHWIQRLVDYPLNFPKLYVATANQINIVKQVKTESG